MSRLILSFKTVRIEKNKHFHNLICVHFLSLLHEHTVARFARVRIEDSSFKRFAINGIQRDFFGGIFSGGIFVGVILSGYPFMEIWPLLRVGGSAYLYLGQGRYVH